MSKFYQIIKAFQESFKRKSLFSSWYQPPRYLPSSHAGGNPGQKKVKYRKEVVNYVRSAACFQGRKLDTSFLSEIPPTLIFTRELSSKYLNPEESNLKKSRDDNKDLIIIPTWMKKPRIRKFQDKFSSNKHKAHNSVQNEVKTELTESETKFKLICYLNKKPKTLLPTENVKQKNFYKVILSKLSLPHFETKNIIGKKNSIKYNSSTSHSVFEKSTKLKKIIERNESGNKKAVTNICQNRDVTTDTNENLESFNQVNSLESTDVIDNYSEKSKLADTKYKLKKPEDRSQIRRYKQQNGIKEDEQALKLKAKKFEKIHKPEVEFYLKKLAAKYGKITCEKEVKPKRIYDNNMQRITYDLRKQNEQINYMGNKGSMKFKVPFYPKKQIKIEIEKLKMSNRENNKGKCRAVLHESPLKMQNETTKLCSIENKGKRGKILRKEDFAVNTKVLKEIQKGTKKSKATVKMNLTNGLLKDKGTSYETSDKFLKKKNIGTEISSTETNTVKVDNSFEKFPNENEKKNVKNEQINITNNECVLSTALTKNNSDQFLNKCKESTAIQNFKTPKQIEQQSTSDRVIENKSLERLEGNVLPKSTCLEVKKNNNQCLQNNNIISNDNKLRFNDPVNFQKICAKQTENHGNTIVNNEVISSSVLMANKKSTVADLSNKREFNLKEQQKPVEKDENNHSRIESENYDKKSISETQEKFVGKSKNQSMETTENQQLQKANTSQAEINDMSHKMESIRFASITNSVKISKQRMITRKYKISRYPPITNMEENTDWKPNNTNEFSNKNKEVISKQKNDISKVEIKKPLVKEKTYLPSKVEFIKPYSVQQLPVPLKMYRFYCHNETLDYRVYKCAFQPAAPSKDKQHLEETEGLKGNDYPSKKRFPPLINLEAHQKAVKYDKDKIKSSIANLNVVKDEIHDKKEKRFPPIIDSGVSNDTLGIANENKILSTDSNSAAPLKTPLPDYKRERFPPIINTEVSNDILGVANENKILSSDSNLAAPLKTPLPDYKRERFPPIIDSKLSNDTLGIANENKVLSTDSNLAAPLKTPLPKYKRERFPPIINTEVSNDTLGVANENKILSSDSNLVAPLKTPLPDYKRERFPPIIDSKVSNDTLGIANKNKILSTDSNLAAPLKRPLPKYKRERFPPIINTEVSNDTLGIANENKILSSDSNIAAPLKTPLPDYKRKRFPPIINTEVSNDTLGIANENKILSTDSNLAAPLKTPLPNYKRERFPPIINTEVSNDTLGVANENKIHSSDSNLAAPLKTPLSNYKRERFPPIINTEVSKDTLGVANKNKILSSDSNLAAPLKTPLPDYKRERFPPIINTEVSNVTLGIANENKILSSDSNLAAPLKTPPPNYKRERFPPIINTEVSKDTLGVANKNKILSSDSNLAAPLKTPLPNYKRERFPPIINTEVSNDTLGVANENKIHSSDSNLAAPLKTPLSNYKRERFPPIINTEVSKDTLGVANKNKILSSDSNLAAPLKTPLPDYKRERFPPIINTEVSNVTLGIANENKILSSDSNLAAPLKTPPPNYKRERFPPIINTEVSKDTLGVANKNKILSSDSNLAAPLKTPLSDYKRERFPPIINTEVSNVTLGIANENKILSPDSNLAAPLKTPLPNYKRERFPPIINTEVSNVTLGIANENKILSPDSNLAAPLKTPLPDYKRERFPPIINTEVLQDTSCYAKENKRLPPITNLDSGQESQIVNLKKNKEQIVDIFIKEQETANNSEKQISHTNVENPVAGKKKEALVEITRRLQPKVNSDTASTLQPKLPLKLYRVCSDTSKSPYSEQVLYENTNIFDQTKLGKTIHLEAVEEIEHIGEENKIYPSTLKVDNGNKRQEKSSPVGNLNTSIDQMDYVKNKRFVIVINLKQEETTGDNSSKNNRNPPNKNIATANGTLRYKEKSNQSGKRENYQKEIKHFVKEQMKFPANCEKNAKGITKHKSGCITNKSNVIPFNSAMTNAIPQKNTKSHSKLLPIIYLEEKSKQNIQKSSAKENLISELEINKQLQAKSFGNQNLCSEQGFGTTNCQQISPPIEQGLCFESNHVMNNDKALKKQSHDIHKSFLSSTSEIVNDILTVDNSFKEKKDFIDVQLKNLTADKQVKDNKTKIHPNSAMKMDEYVSKFVDVVINKKILGETPNTNLFLMHGFNKMSFLKGLFEIQFITQKTPIMALENNEINLLKDNNSEKNARISLNKIQVLANDLKIMVNKQMEFHKRGMMKKQLKRKEQRDKLSIYNLFDYTFVLQSFDKVSFKRIPFKHLFFEEPDESNIVKESRKIPQQIKINVSNTNKIETNDNTFKVINRFEKCGRIFVKQYPNEFFKVFSFLEELDFRMPTKNKDFASDDIRAQKYNIVNLKHMSFYTKYRMNIWNNEEILKNKKNINNIELKNENISNKITKPKMHKFMTTDERNYLEDDYKHTNLRQSPEKMLIFKEMHEHYNKNIPENKYIPDTVNKERASGKQVTIYNGIIDESSPTSKVHLEKDKTKDFMVKEKQDIQKKNNYCTISKQEFELSKSATSSYGINSKEYQNTGKVEPEVLHYIHKLLNTNMIVTTKKSLTTMTSHSLAPDKKSIEGILTTKESSIDTGSQNNKNEVNLNKIIEDEPINVSIEEGHEKKRKKKNFLKEISYSSDIKILEKPGTNVLDIIKDCKKGNFKYLTKVIQNQKNCTNNLTQTKNFELLKKLEQDNISTKQETDELMKYKNKNTFNELSVASSANYALKNDANTTFELHIKTVSPNFKTTNDEIILKDNQIFITAPNILSKEKENINITATPSINTNTQVPAVQKQENISNTEHSTISITEETIPTGNKYLSQNANSAETNIYKNLSLSDTEHNMDELGKNSKELEQQFTNFKRLENNLPKAKNQELNTIIVLQSPNNINRTEVAKNISGFNKKNMEEETTKYSLDNDSECITTQTKHNKKNEIILKTKDEPLNPDLINSTQLITVNSKADKNAALDLKKDIEFHSGVERRIPIPSQNKIGENTCKSTSIEKSITTINSASDISNGGKNIAFNIDSIEKNVSLSSKNLHPPKTEDIHKQKLNCSKEEKNLQIIKSELRDNPGTMTKDDCNIQNFIKKDCKSHQQNVVNKEVASNVSLTRSEGKSFPRCDNGNSEKSLNKTNIEIKVEKGRLQNKQEEKIKETIKNFIRNKYKKFGKNESENMPKKSIANQNTKKDIDAGLHAEHIPSGSRCIKQRHTELTKDKDNMQSQIKSAESIPETDNLNKEEKKDMTTCLTNETTIPRTSHANAKSLTEECSSTSKLNKFLLDHKKQLENITKHKRANSIKNKLSNNLKPKDENKIIHRPPNTLMSLLNTESERKRNEDIKKQGTEYGLHLQKESVDLVKSKPFPFKRQPACFKKAVLKHQDTENFSNNNTLTDSKRIKQNVASTTYSSKGKVAFPEDNNNDNQENNFKQFNEYTDYMLMKTNNTGFNFNEQELIITDSKKRKEMSDINSLLGIHPFNRNMKVEEEKNHKENPVYILKPQPKIEGFISRTLRSSDSRRSISPMLGITKKQWGYYRNLGNQSIQSGSKQLTPSVLKHKISKYRIFNADSRINKNEMKKNFTHSNASTNRPEFTLDIIDQNKTYKPLQICNKEVQRRFISKHNILETPSRQACGLIPPIRVQKMKPVLLKEKIPTKLMVCTAPTTAVCSRKPKIEKKDKASGLAESAFFGNQIRTKNQMKESQHTQTFQEMCLLSKNKIKQSKLTPVFNIEKSYSNDKGEERITKNENIERAEDSKEVEENPIQTLSYCDTPITEKNKNTPEDLIATNASSNNELKADNKSESSEADSKLPSIVDNVVNNVKERLLNLPSSVSKIMYPSHIPKKAWLDITDIVKYNTLLKGSKSIKKWQQKFDNFQNQIRPTRKLDPVLNSHRKKKGLAKQNQNEIIQKYGNTPIPVTGNDMIKQAFIASKPSSKMKVKSKNKRDTFQRRRRISDMLKFKPHAIKKTCPQMSYSEVLNKFYACSESQAVK